MPKISVAKAIDEMLKALASDQIVAVLPTSGFV